MDTIVYSLTVYFFYHLLCRSDILAKPRALIMKLAPRALGYIYSCPFCFTFWVGVALVTFTLIDTHFLVLNPDMLFAAPVINYLVGSVVQVLDKMSQPSIDRSLVERQIKESIIHDLRQNGTVLT